MANEKSSGLRSRSYPTSSLRLIVFQHKMEAGHTESNPLFFRGKFIGILKLADQLIKRFKEEHADSGRIRRTQCAVATAIATRWEVEMLRPSD